MTARETQPGIKPGISAAPTAANPAGAVNPLDAETWDGPPAPEGSPERIEARRRLWDLARRAARVREQPAAEWLAGVRREAPQLVGAVGERDLAALVAYVWRAR